MIDLKSLTIKKIHQGLKNREFSSQEIAGAYLNNIEANNKELNAFITITKKQALEQAKRADYLLSQGREVSVLAGVPAAIKDNILIQDIACTAGSKILENYIAPYDAGAIAKLRKQNAVFLGKTNLDEFAMGASGEHSAFGPTKNPVNKDYVPGGSSAGSAAAVSANMAPFALGSDTAGSVRQPASFCGMVGMKPTYGAVSRYGLIAMASSLDQIGVIAKNTEDAEIVFKVIAGKDPLDSTSCALPEKESKDVMPKKMTVGLPKEIFAKGVDEEIIRIVKKATLKLAQGGVNIEEVTLPHMQYGIACYYIIMPAEVSSNLARYDGIRFGCSVTESQMDPMRNDISGAGTDALLEVYLQSREQGFGIEPKRRIMLGTYSLSSGYYEAYYLRAQKVRSKIIEDFNKVFQSVDLLLMPTSPTLPFKLGEKISDPLSMYMSDLMTVPANLAGLPAISLPAGAAKGLPVGIQFVAPQFGEKPMFQMAKFFEQIWIS
jgi:aspartyl-tRNA(Asn)/glutamyl-tRNA(Gln) amidotransferase subunit A